MTSLPAPDGTGARPDCAAAEAAAQALALRLSGAMLATQESFTAYLGVKLGLYQALCDGGPATAGQLAGRAGLDPRYVREWLEQQAAAGLLTVDDPGLAGDLRSYRIPPGHERVLTKSADSMSLVWTALLPIGAVAGVLPRLLEAFRTGEGIPPDAFGADWRHGHGGANRALYTHQLVGWLRRLVPAVHRRLSAGPASVADVGCGAGWAGIALARGYPSARVTGIDVDAVTIEQARRNAVESGVGAQMSFRVADAAGPEMAEQGYDLLCVFDTLHELARPVEALRACRVLRAPSGTVLVLESRVAESFRVPADEIERFQYATSVLHCLPAGLVGERAVGTGTVMRPGALRAVARAAGFHTVRDYDLENDRFHRLYELADLCRRTSNGKNFRVDCPAETKLP